MLGERRGRREIRARRAVRVWKVLGVVTGSKTQRARAFYEVGSQTGAGSPIIGTMFVCLEGLTCMFGPRFSIPYQFFYLVAW